MDRSERMNRHHYHLQGWCVFELLHALEKVGVNDVLREYSTVSVPLSKLVERCNVDRELLLETLQLLEVLDNTLISVTNGESVSAGPAFFAHFFQNQLYFTAAYKKSLNGIHERLRSPDAKTLVNFEYLRRSSELHNGVFTARLVNIILQRQNVSCVVDLGCGSGHLLRALHRERDDLELIGIDTQLPIAEYDGIQFIRSSYEEPEQWSHHLSQYKGSEVVFVAVTALHECAGDRIRLQKLFDTYANLFPESVFFILEHTSLGKDELLEMAESERVPRGLYLYIHTLTKQGEPMTAREWSTYLSDCGVSVVSTIPLSEHMFVLEVPMVL